MGIIAWPFGKLLWLCYEIISNYGWALFLFSLLIKLIMLPSSCKQQLSMAKTQKLGPKLEQLKKKYANNKEKLNEATMELYNQENVNPMGSCLPMVLTMVILIAVVEVVYAPLSYISGLPKEKIESAQTVVYDVYTVSSAVKSYTQSEDGANTATVAGLTAEGRDIYEVLTEIKADSSKGKALQDYSDERLRELSDILTSNPGIDEYFTNPEKVSQRLLAGGDSTRLQLLIMSASQDYPAIFDPEVTEFCSEFDYTFLGVNLGRYPSWNSILVLIPIVSLVLQLAITVLSQYYSKKNGGVVQKGGMGAMLYIMPLISFWIAFSFPAGIGIYWIFQSILSLLQTVLLNLYYNPKRVERLLAKAESKAKRKPSLYQMALEQQRSQGSNQTLKEDLDGEEPKLSRAEKKEAQRLTLNEARRRYSEKYGDGEILEDTKAPDQSDGDDAVLEEARRRYAEKYGDAPKQ